MVEQEKRQKPVQDRHHQRYGDITVTALKCPYTKKDCDGYQAFEEGPIDKPPKCHHNTHPGECNHYKSQVLPEYRRKFKEQDKK
jgi:hypothetical protein